MEDNWYSKGLIISLAEINSQFIQSLRIVTAGLSNFYNTKEDKYRHQVVDVAV